MNNQRYEVEEEINAFSPGLSKLLQQRKITGIPAEYFENNEKMLAGLTLLSYAEEHRFEDIPEGYFQKMEKTVMSQSVREKRRIQPVYWMAAASVVMMVMALVFWPTTKDVSADETEMVWMYLEEQSHTLDLDDLVNAGLITEESFSTEEWPEELPFDSINLSDLEEDL
jgi:hypothetical protein